MSTIKSILVSALTIIMISAGVLSNIYESLNISQDDAKECLFNSIVEGFVVRGDHHDLVSNARALPASVRAEGVRELILMAKSYAATEKFKKDYKKWRSKKLSGGGGKGIPNFGKMLDKAIDNRLEKEKNEKLYPVEPDDMIRKRLTDFLEISATVDFDAEVNGGQFVQTEYQNKSSWWKMCFRAGKPVIDAAREEAQKWLDELNGK
jgi:hypothetical protein